MKIKSKVKFVQNNLNCRVNQKIHTGYQKKSKEKQSFCKKCAVCSEGIQQLSFVLGFSL